MAMAEATQDKPVTAVYAPLHSLKYGPRNAKKELNPDGDDKTIVVRISKSEGSGVKLIGNQDLRIIEIQYAWDKKEKSTSRNPEKLSRVKQMKAKLIVESISGFDSSLEQLLDEDPRLFEQILESYQELLGAKEITNPDQTGMKPFKCVVRFLPQMVEQEILHRHLMPRNEYDPGTLPGHEGVNEKRYYQAIAKRAIKSFEGLYDAEGKELVYQGDSESQDMEVLHEFIDRNPLVFQDLMEFARNFRAMLRKEKKIFRQE
ncbi:MAG: hypothetical protein HQM11_07645 [SAR324 cluster bacterium]|nr:hypothetical protein [SAR324 cluster bacterium]